MVTWYPPCCLVSSLQDPATVALTLLTIPTRYHPRLYCSRALTMKSLLASGACVGATGLAVARAICRAVTVHAKYLSRTFQATVAAAARGAAMSCTRNSVLRPILINRKEVHRKEREGSVEFKDHWIVHPAVSAQQWSVYARWTKVLLSAVTDLQLQPTNPTPLRKPSVRRA